MQTTGNKSFGSTRRSRIFATAAGLLASAMGGAALIGWWLNDESLKCIVPGSTPLKPNIAAGFLLCGAALTLLSGKKLREPIRVCTTAIATAVVALGALTLGEYFFNWNIGIDHWLVRDFPAPMGAVNPGRMMPTTALCFALMGAALFAKTKLIPRRFGFPLVAGLSAALVIIGVLALGGFSLEKLFGPGWNLMGMSVSGLTGAAGFMILGSGLLALLQSKGALRWSLDPLTTVGFAVGIFLTVLTTASAFTFGKRMLETTNLVAHRQEVLKEVQQCMTGMAELGSSERVYAIVGDEGLVKERDQKSGEVKRDIDDIRKLTVNNPNQQRHLDRLAPLIAQRIAWEEKVIAARREQGPGVAAQMIATGPGLGLSEEIFGLLKDMQNEEYGLLGADRKQAEMASRATFLLLPLGVFVSLGVLTLGVFFLNAGVSAQAQSEKELRGSEAQLQTIVQNLDEGVIVSDLNGRLLQWNRAALQLHGYDSSEQDRRRFTELVDTFELSTLEGLTVPVEQWPLARILRGENLHDLELRVRRIGSEWTRVFNYGGTLVHDDQGGALMAVVTLADITARKQGEEQIRQLNVELEERVERRTAELEAANKELEAFSYSVSHDLRAPLRAVDGFSQAALEDYGAQLPEEGRRYLQTIREGAQRMGTLIDDLLTFSRLSRLPLHKQTVATARLVRDSLDELDSEKDGRKIDVRVSELPICHGDPALLKQVWMNLLSNALKYTRNRETAVIEVGCQADNGEVIYFVRDNGTGFDMQYAGKLFGVFQRLHRADEFEGTGVGLAIAQRVIHRHGGRIWAEAAVDRGATFQFTLGEKNHV